MMQPADPDILTTKQVAQLLQVSPKTVRDLPIPCAPIGSRTMRYLRKDVMEYLEKLAHPRPAGRR